MDLPGRPGGSADALRAGARAWEHLAWEVWHLTRPLEKHMTALLEGWSGPAADAHRARWEQVRRGLGEFDHRAHTAADYLRRFAGQIEDAQSGYDLALGAAGVITVVGIGLTLVSGGGSDALAGEADTALAAQVTGMVAQFELLGARVSALISEVADLMGSLASRFAMEFAIKGPELAYGPAGGGAIGVGLALASGVRDPGDIATSGLLGAVESAGGGRKARSGRGEAEEPDTGEPPAQGLPRTSPPDSVEAAWRSSLSPAQAAKQEEYDVAAVRRAADTQSIREPLTPEVVGAIETRFPGSVRYVGRNVVDPASPRGDPLTDLDIETSRVIIQVKSGGTEGLSRQIDRSRAVSGKPVVGYAPEMTPERAAWYQRHGYAIFFRLDDLLQFIATKG